MVWSVDQPLVHSHFVTSEQWDKEHVPDCKSATSLNHTVCFRLGFFVAGFLWSFVFSSLSSSSTVQTGYWFALQYTFLISSCHGLVLWITLIESQLGRKTWPLIYTYLILFVSKNNLAKVLIIDLRYLKGFFL